MKKICFLSALLMMLGLSQFSFVQALHSEPAGKNLMNPAHFYTDDTHIYTTTPLDVEAHTVYTFAIPTLIGATTLPDHIKITQTGTTLVDATTSTNDAVCYSDDPYGIEKLICTFETTTDTTLDIEIEGDIDPRSGMQDLEDIQLEVGSTYTGFEPFESISEPVFQGQGLLVLDYHDSLTLDDIIGTHITAYDEIDGDLTEDIIVISDDYTGNENTVGDYWVSLEVYDSSGNGASFELNIVIQDNVPPEIIGHNVIYTEVDDLVPLDTLITNHFEFYDAHDGVIDTYTIIYDHYTNHEDSLGDKEVQLEISDNAGNTADIVFRVRVEDNVAPVIIGPNHVELYLSEDWKEADILNLFEVSDNYTAIDAIETFIASEAHPQDYDATGEYTVTFKAVDGSDNASTHDFTLEIIDDVAPVITGPYLEEVSYKDTFDLLGFVDRLSVTDNHCNLSSQDIQLQNDNYQPNIPGDYTATYIVSDSSGNEATYNLNIRVIDDVSPIFNLDQTIVVSKNTKIGEDEILTYFENTFDDDDIEIDNYRIVYNDYQGNEAEVGTYEIGIEMQDTNGNNYQKMLLIEVTEVEDSKDYTWVIWPVSIVAALFSIVFFKRRF